jgi:hypothetical protein
MRIAKGKDGKPRVDASVRPNHAPLFSGKGTRHEQPLPTAAFAVEIEVPESVLRRAEQVIAEMEIPEDDAKAIVWTVEA